MNININQVSETALLMVQCHAQDALSKRPILSDRSSIKVMNAIRKEAGNSSQKLHKVLSKGRIDKALMQYIVLRAQRYDQYVKDYIQKYPDAVIVNIGCGLDGRFNRVDNGQITFYDLDLPDIIEMKKSLFEETDRFKFIDQSVFDLSWTDIVKNDHVLFLAEGVFMYCDESDVQSLFRSLLKIYPDSEMVCELFNAKLLQPGIKMLGYMAQKLRYGFGQDASFKFGVHSSREICAWSSGIQLLDEWSYIDSNHPNLGAMRYLRFSKIFKKFIWTAHFRFNYR